MRGGTQGCEVIHIDGRMDDCGVAMVAAKNALADVVGNGDEAGYSPARIEVPTSQSVENPVGERAPDAMFRPDRCQVSLAHVPSVAHRRQAVTDVELPCMCAYALSYRM